MNFWLNRLEEITEKLWHIREAATQESLSLEQRQANFAALLDELGQCYEVYDQINFISSKNIHLDFISCKIAFFLYFTHFSAKKQIRKSL